jgi:hypothetical protein
VDRPDARGGEMIFEIDTTKKRETIDITDRVREIVRTSKPTIPRGL